MGAGEGGGSRFVCKQACSPRDFVFYSEISTQGLFRWLWRVVALERERDTLLATKEGILLTPEPLENPPPPAQTQNKTMPRQNSTKTNP